MPEVTTFSGQADRVIDLFKQAQASTAAARDAAASLQELVNAVSDQAVVAPTGDGRVCVEIPAETWQRLTAAAVHTT